MDINHSIEYFYDFKKTKQNELRLEKEKLKLQARQEKWAARLQPLDSATKQCCKAKCINGCIPLPLLERTRKVGNTGILSSTEYVESSPLVAGLPEVQRSVRQKAVGDRLAGSMQPVWLFDRRRLLPHLLERSNNSLWCQQLPVANCTTNPKCKASSNSKETQ
jgi:hypothetical protein